ncbi:PREDICTED: cytochrome P450 2J6-like [Gekko japonicus]|uniref:Cytochrome P450 2J6-like n=1 Tax=Gekko japonicus TaxID=146911 RepID=A0ABM1KG34_GEKJA|nr:PREDICTED: cytochrome P450 2J6-like [Gekko japonicus]
MGHIPLVVLCGFEAVQEALINHSEDFVERPLGHFLKALAQEKGIIFSNGHTWKQQRKFGLATMRKLGLGKKGMEHQVEEEAHQLVETFARAKGHSINGKEFKVSLFPNALTIHVTDPLTTLPLYILFPRLMESLPGPHKKVLAYTETVRSFVKEEIQQHKEKHAVHDPQDFIDFYLFHMEKQSTDEPNSTYNEENLAQCISDLFLAGTETTATALQWALLLMANHPDIQEKVQKEVEDTLGSSQSFSYQDRKRLPYTNAVIHEILRAYYVLFVGIPRKCMKDVNILGFLIPKGTHVIADFRSVLLDPKQWEKPQDFNPNHFLDQDGSFVEREAFLPFGAGARVCLGELLARIELFIFFTSLLRAFSFELPEGVKELNAKPIFGGTLHPHPYKLCAVPRCSTS